MELYCEKDKDTGEYRHFYKHNKFAELCGALDEDIIKAKLVEVNDGEGSHYGYRDNKTGDFSFIFKHRVGVQVCSADFFKSKISRGEGDIVCIRVVEFN